MPPLSDNSKLLIQALEAEENLEGRFEKLKFVNFDSANDEKRGCFSLVFQAHDCVENEIVALKFYDINPQLFLNEYRRNAFVREHQILQTLMGKERCLQLASALSTYNFNIPTTEGGPVITVPCQYFAVAWIDNEIDGYFLQQEKFEAAEKLRLFNEIVLAVEALHRYEVFHRDLKPDNLRAYENALKRIVVAIDLGTAARFTSKYIQNDYGHQVGALAYASPEARAGLAPHRQLAPYNDVYALGCLLFELFNRDLFFRALQTSNPKYETVLVGLQTYLSGAKNEVEQKALWGRGLATLSKGVAPVEIEGFGGSVPAGVAPQINGLMQRMTHVDYAIRPLNLEWVRQRVWSVIRCLENERQYQHRLRLRREYRRLRLEKISARQKRLLQYVAKRGLSC